MKNSRIIYVVVSLLLTGSIARAQHRVMMNVNYSVNVPLGDFKEFIPSTSFRGWTASVMYRINQKVAVGATTGFQDFHKKADEIWKDALRHLGGDYEMMTNFPIDPQLN